MVSIGYQAMLVVLGPGIVMAIAFDIYRRVKHKPKGRFTSLFANAGVALLGDAWSEYVIYYSNGLGVPESQLQVVRSSLTTLSGYLPSYIRIFFPDWLLALILISACMFGFLSF